ncbi:aromatic acid exporter family protein [Gottfriedia sp. NPDC058432]|uniref:FUSC family protein n=1 Tax=Bacillaceae TaxID=186817 RepID=UPI0006F715C5|nr:aromatic acid exporter family protein [Bacillus sp. FJAT-25509]
MEETQSLNSSENITSLIWKLSIGSTLAWEISNFFGSSHPYLGPVSLILTIQSTMDKTINLSIKRVIGTMIGIGITVIIASYLKVTGWNLGLLILIGTYIAKFLKLDKKVLHQVALTILFVFAFEHQSKDYAMDRMRDTLVGVLTAGLIQVIWSSLISRKKELK